MPIVGCLIGRPRGQGQESGSASGSARPGQAAVAVRSSVHPASPTPWDELVKDGVHPVHVPCWSHTATDAHGTCKGRVSSLPAKPRPLRVSYCKCSVMYVEWMCNCPETRAAISYSKRNLASTIWGCQRARFLCPEICLPADRLPRPLNAQVPLLIVS